MLKDQIIRVIVLDGQIFRGIVLESLTGALWVINCAPRQTLCLGKEGTPVCGLEFRPLLKKNVTLWTSLNLNSLSLV